MQLVSGCLYNFLLMISRCLSTVRGCVDPCAHALALFRISQPCLRPLLNCSCWLAIAYIYTFVQSPGTYAGATSHWIIFNVIRLTTLQPATCESLNLAMWSYVCPSIRSVPPHKLYARLLELEGDNEIVCRLQHHNTTPSRLFCTRNWEANWPAWVMLMQAWFAGIHPTNMTIVLCGLAVLRKTADSSLISKCYCYIASRYSWSRIDFRAASELSWKGINKSEFFWALWVLDLVRLKNWGIYISLPMVGFTDTIASQWEG